MKIAVFGSRDISNYYSHIVNLYVAHFPRNTEVVSGGARGIDELAKMAAFKYNLGYKEFPADWDKYGKAAGFVRNTWIADYVDCGIAFWDGKSHGTQDTINKLKELGKPIKIVQVETIADINKWCNEWFK